MLRALSEGSTGCRESSVIPSREWVHVVGSRERQGVKPEQVCSLVFPGVCTGLSF